MNINEEVARVMDELAIAEREYENEQKPLRDRVFTEKRRKHEELRYRKQHGIEINDLGVL